MGFGFRFGFGFEFGFSPFPSLPFSGMETGTQKNLEPKDELFRVNGFGDFYK